MRYDSRWLGDLRCWSALVAAVLLFPVCCTGADLTDARARSVSVTAHPPTQSRNSHYVGYRAPLMSTPLVELPLGAVQPRGWLRKQLQL